MNEFLNNAREALDKAVDMAVEKAQPVVEEVKDKAEELYGKAAEKAAAVGEDVKETVEEIKTKAAPVVEKVKDGVNDAIEAVKDGAEKVGDLLDGNAGAREVKNELFDSLEEGAVKLKADAQSRAEEMQKKLQELMKGGKAE